MERIVHHKGKTRRELAYAVTSLGPNEVEPEPALSSVRRLRRRQLERDDPPNCRIFPWPSELPHNYGTGMLTDAGFPVHPAAGSQRRMKHAGQRTLHESALTCRTERSSNLPENLALPEDQ